MKLSAAGFLIAATFAHSVHSSGTGDVGASCKADEDCDTGLACIDEVCGEEIVVTAPRPHPRLRAYFPGIPPIRQSTPGGYIPQALIVPSNAYDQNDDGKIDCWARLTGDENARISSGQGYRKHPLTGKWTYHNGIDIDVPTGTIVTAAQSGRVKETERRHSIGEGTGNGNFVRINFDDGTQGVYLHLWTVRVRYKDTVSPGQIIGNSDDTGSSTRPHLHYSIWRQHDHNQVTDNPDNFHEPVQRYGSNCS